MTSRKSNGKAKPAAPAPPAADSFRLPQICAVIAVGIASLALAGWQMNARFLAGQWDTYIPMAPSTALAFLLLGGALFCYARWPAQRLSRLFALAAVSLTSLLALLVLAQFSSGIDLGVEGALARTNEWLGTAPLGRMSPLTAIAFLLESAALFMLLIGQRWRNAPTAAALLAVIATVINFVVLAGYAYGAPLLYGGTNIPVALPTAIAFVWVGLGQITLAVPSAPALAAWSRATLRGRLLRAFLPSLLVFLLIQGWLELRIEPFLSPTNLALWHSLAALTAGALIVTVTGWIAGRTGDDLEQAQARIRSLARFADENPNPVLRFARDGRLLYANPSSRRLLEGWGCEQVGQSLPEAERRWIAETLERGVSQNQDAACGEITYWLMLTPVPEMDYVNIYGRDITERKQAEEALWEHERQLSSIYDTVADVIFHLAVEMDGRYRFASVNKSFLSVTGLGYDQVVGKRVDEAIPEPSLTLVLAKYGEAIREKRIVRWEETSEYPTGRLMGEVSVAPVFDDAGNCTHLVGAVHDITDRKRAEAALRESEALYRRAIEAAGAVPYYRDHRTNSYAFMGEGILQMTGYPASEMTPEVLVSLEQESHMRGEAASLSQEEAIRRARAGELREWRNDSRILSRDGKTRWIADSAVDVLDERGVAVGSIGILQDITERKRAEDALRESESLLRESQIIAGLGSYVLDFSTGTWKSSGILDKIFGIDEAYVRSVEGWTDLVHPDERQQMMGYFTNEVIGQRVRFDKEYRIIRKNDQAERWVHGVGELEVDAQNQLSKMHGTITDITKYKQAEEALRENEQRLQVVLSSVNMAVFHQDRALRYTWIYQPQLGYRPEQVVGHTDAELLPPEAARRVTEIKQRALEMGVRAHEEVSVAVEGATFVYDLVAEPLRDASGAIIGLTGATLDITERVRAEEAARQAEQRYRQLFEEAPAMYVITRRQEGGPVVADCNELFLTTLGYTQAEVVGQPLADFYTPASRPKMLAGGYQRALKGEFLSEERELVGRDGRIIKTLVRAMPEVALDGQITGTRAMYVDVTERKQAEERLRLSDEILQRVSSLVLVANAQGQITYASPYVTTALGYELAELLGEGWWELSRADPQERAREKDYVTQAARGEVPLSETPYERQVRARDGEFRWIIWQDARTPGELVVGVGHDITERKQRERELETIAAVSTALRKAATRAEMLPIILDQLISLLKAGAASFDAVDPVTGDVVVELARGAWAAVTGAQIPLARALSAQVISTGQVFVTQDAATDQRIAFPDLATHTRAMAAVPLIAREKAIGALWMGRANEITDSDLRLLTAIADIAANAIQRATLHEQTEQRLQHLAALRAVDMAISSSFDLQVTLGILLGQTLAQLRVDAADILLLNPVMQTLDYAAGRGFRGGGITRSHIRLGECQAGLAALERRTAYLPNLAEATTFVRAGLLAGENFVAHYVTPLIAKGQVKGVLEVFHRAPLAPDPEWLDFLEALAGQAAIAIDNNELFDGLQRSNAELAVAYDATIEGWSHALDLRDKETEGHTQRVTEMTLRLARAMNMSEADLVHVRRGALLHDIGKMGVPDSILLKPGPLTEEEWAMMRQHPTHAFEMLSPIDYLRRALDIPYCHHEKWDGAGYPRGLKGERIPLAARIFAVVDVWDALRSDRPYRAGWPEEQVREYIREQAGKHFDPAVAEMFLRELTQ